jgi:carbon storage regulator
MGLTVSRKPGESICVGDEIVITVNRVKGKVVSFTVDAPQGLAIDRSEVRERKRLEAAQ